MATIARDDAPTLMAPCNSSHLEVVSYSKCVMVPASIYEKH